MEIDFCKNCYSEAPENQGIQDFFVEVKEIDFTFIGHGMSLVNNAKFMQAQVRSKDTIGMNFFFNAVAGLYTELLKVIQIS